MNHEDNYDLLSKNLTSEPSIHQLRRRRNVTKSDSSDGLTIDSIDPKEDANNLLSELESEQNGNNFTDPFEFDLFWI